MRNSLLVEGSCADNERDSSTVPKRRAQQCAVGERSQRAEAVRTTGRGLLASDYVGMSNDKTGENPVHRKSKVSSGRLVLWRLVGPKARPNGVVDGHRVDIPEPE